MDFLKSRSYFRGLTQAVSHHSSACEVVEHFCYDPIPPAMLSNRPAHKATAEHSISRSDGHMIGHHSKCSGIDKEGPVPAQLPCCELRSVVVPTVSNYYDTVLLPSPTAAAIAVFITSFISIFLLPCGRPSQICLGRKLFPNQNPPL